MDLVASSPEWRVRRSIACGPLSGATRARSQTELVFLGVRSLVRISGIHKSIGQAICQAFPHEDLPAL
jgi:hypothetical protein